MIDNTFPDCRGNRLCFVTGRNADTNSDNPGFIENLRVNRRLEQGLCGVLGGVLPGERAIGELEIVSDGQRLFAMLNGTISRGIKNSVIPPARISA